MGSLVVRCYLKKYDDELDSLIVCGSPSENKAAKAAEFLAKTACKMGAHKRKVLSEDGIWLIWKGIRRR